MTGAARAAGLLVAAILAAWAAGAAAHERTVCDPRDRMLDRLARGYQEHLAAAGVTSDGALLEVLIAPAGATWSIILTYPERPTCLVAAGEGWRRQAAPPQGEPL